MAIQLLCTNASVRRAIVREQGISSIILLSKHSSAKYQLCAAVALSLISSDEDCRVHTATEGIVSILDLCNTGAVKIQREAFCAVANLADCLDAHQILLEAQTVESIRELADSCTDSILVREMTRFFASISVDDFAKEKILDNNILPYLMKFSRRTDSATRRYSSLAICNLSLMSSKRKGSIIENDGLLRLLIFLSRCSDLEVERCSILSLAALALGTSGAYKETIASAGTLQPILKSMRYPDVEMQQCSSLALNALVLSETDTTKIKIKGMEDDLPGLFALLAVDDDECVHNGVYALGSMIESGEVRDALVRQGCIQAVTDIMSSASIEVKRACGYLFSVLAEHVSYHQELSNSGAMEQIVNLAGLVDMECQIYGAFSLVFLANNPDLQVPLVQLGAVRYLVSMMATESEPRHYAGLALLKLADNFENHITIAEQGGIQALLKLGRSRVANDEVQYKAALTVGSLASKAVANLPKLPRNRFGDEIGAGAMRFQKK
eukprot:CAMPEP_0197238714 /NCGR_PEP_ID=MMETSP1429-20130617/5240_1 /TAXON_ID=49237 /ORGANISM="Chaetoceros  sp., Strain UNC1202" /LENGTH=495 /DNA_ID=CAMNT_0042697959 /DNA_START=188 /DNA_END=1675 /DNA_ORIENTATION=-